MVKQLTIYELLTDYSEVSFKEKEELEDKNIKCYICDKLPAQYGYNFWKDDKGKNVGWVGGGYCENCWKNKAQFKTKQEIEKELGW